MINMYEVLGVKDKNIYSFDYLINMYDNDREKYEVIIKNTACPHCKKDIVEINIDNNFMSMKSKRMKHSHFCDYYGFKVSQQEMKKRIKDKVGFDDLLNKKGKKLIPKRMINRPLREDDFDVYKMFYGEAVIKEAYSKDENKYINFSFKSSIGDAIGITFQKKHFETNDEVINILNANIDKKIKFKVIGKVNEVGEYNNILLEHPSLFIID